MKKLLKTILKFFLLKPLAKVMDIQDKKEKNKLEYLKEYAEELLLSTDIELENVYVHGLGGWGLCGKSSYGFTHKKFSTGVVKKYEIAHKDKAYIFVPEIVDTWSFHAWIHEIGHYVNGHYKDIKKPVYIKEYEAETYAINLARECEKVTEYMMIEIEIDSWYYVYSHVLKAVENGELEYIDDIEPDVMYFICNSTTIKDELDSKFDESRIKYLKEKVV